MAGQAGHDARNVIRKFGGRRPTEGIAAKAAEGDSSPSPPRGCRGVEVCPTPAKIEGRQQAPCREGGEMRRPEGTGRHGVEAVFPLRGGCHEVTGG